MREQSTSGKALACEQALLFGQTKRASRERASEGPFPCASRLCRSLTRSRETRFSLAQIGELARRLYRLKWNLPPRNTVLVESDLR